MPPCWRRINESSCTHSFQWLWMSLSTLHLATSCIFSDRLSIWFFKTFPFTLGHKCLCKISSSIPTPYANLTEITSMKAIDMRCIWLIISSFQYQRPWQERVRLLLLVHTTFNEDDCVECLRRSVSFTAVCASACWEILRYSSAVTLHWRCRIWL